MWEATLNLVSFDPLTHGNSQQNALPAWLLFTEIKAK